MGKLRYLFSRGWKKTNDNNIIGHAVLKNWMGYEFSSKKMYPRFDPQGRIYCLICDE